MQRRKTERVSRSYGRSTTSPTTAVVKAIADLEGVAPTEVKDELGFTVYEYVDPDAFDTLVTEGESVSVSVDIADYRVWIDGTDLLVERS